MLTPPSTTQLDAARPWPASAVGGMPGLRAQERRPAVRGPLGRWVDAGVLEDLPDGGCGDLDSQHEQFTVDAPVAPATVLPRRAQHQCADRPQRGRPAGTPGAGDASVMAGDEVAVPAQHGLRAHQQPNPAQHGAGESVQQRGEQRPVSGVNRTFAPCSCRSRTMIWCRRATISASLAWSLMGSRRSIASALVTPRWASRRSTARHRSQFTVSDPMRAKRVDRDKISSR